MRGHCLYRRPINRPMTDKARKGVRRLEIAAPGVMDAAERAFWLENQKTGNYQFDRYGLRRTDGIATHF